MGLGIGFSSCSCAPPQVVVIREETSKKSRPRTEVSSHHILDVQETERHVMLLIQYSSATNYEGKKILVYEGKLKEVLTQGAKHGFDPHFCEGHHLSPIARFAPTEDGWDLAGSFITHCF